jgi:hypothetical protein
VEGRHSAKKHLQQPSSNPTPTHPISVRPHQPASRRAPPMSRDGDARGLEASAAAAAEAARELREAAAALAAARAAEEDALRRRAAALDADVRRIQGSLPAALDPSAVNKVGPPRLASPSLPYPPHPSSTFLLQAQQLPRRRAPRWCVPARACFEFQTVMSFAEPNLYVTTRAPWHGWGIDGRGGGRRLKKTDALGRSASARRPVRAGSQ